MGQRLFTATKKDRSKAKGVAIRRNDGTKNNINAKTQIKAFSKLP